MDILKKSVDVLVGYSGSSEDPTKMSLRMTSITVGVIGKVAAFAALAGYVLPYSDAQLQFVIGSIAVVVASISWSVGLVRALVNAYKNRTMVA